MSEFKVGDLVEVLPGSHEAGAGAIGRVIDAKEQVYDHAEHNPYICVEFADYPEWNVGVRHLKRVGSRLFPKNVPLTNHRL